MSKAEEDLMKAMFRGISRAVILWLLNKQSMSGYAILKEMRRLTGQRVHSGVVYPLLYELEEKGLVAGEWIHRGRRRVKRYSITESGKMLLQRLRKLFRMPVKEVLKDLIGES